MLQRPSPLPGPPNVVRVEPGPRHWSIFERLVCDADARGNLVSDAWLAALAVERGCTFVALDGDVARFDDLDTERP